TKEIDRGNKATKAEKIHGMVSRRKKNPEKKTLGNRNTIDICSACIWFSALVPTSNPRLSSANTYTSVENIMAKTLPSMGTKNTKRMIVNKKTAMVMQMHR